MALFDFDGTITSRDSMIDFLIYAAGFRKFMAGVVVTSPFLIRYMLGNISNHTAKEILIRYFFEGCEESKMKHIAVRYARERLPVIVRKPAIDKIKWHKNEGHRVIIVTASPDIWLKDWCDRNSLELISTELELKDGKFTGNFLGRNCYGSEKVTRVCERLDMSHYNYTYAYGDSRGDAEMLALANERYYRWKKIA